MFDTVVRLTVSTTIIISNIIPYYIFNSNYKILNELPLRLKCQLIIFTLQIDLKL